MTCPACGSAIPDGARFCPSCGRSLHARADERRIATVLFADLVGFTTLSETTDPEQVKNLVDRCFERLVADVTSFGGQVDKIVGDAIVALFGAPVAHEDDAERAVRAALRMQQTLAETAASLPGQQAVVRMRVGVNTGEVLVGALRAGGDYTAMGDVVNTASRLQAAASPGQVLCGPATHAATRNVIRYEHVGPLQAKGREEPVEAWLALEPIAPPGYRPRRLRVPLVGRDCEMGMLAHAVDGSFRRSRAQLVLLVGEAGVGKSRLAEELAARAECDHGAALLEGRCVPYGEANVWWPLADALRRGFGVEPSDDDDAVIEKTRSSVAAVVDESAAGEVERITDGLLHLIGHEGRLAGIEPSRARDEAVRSLRTFLEQYARARPLVLVLSDLHWADEAVLELVDGLLDQLCSLPFVLVATTRGMLSERWTPRPGRHNAVVLNLEPLERTATARLLAALLEGEAPPDVQQLLLDRSGGNPLFLEELVSLLAESGGVAPGRAVHDLPDTLRGLVAARIDGLSPAERATVEDAAVLGHDGPLYALDVMAEARGHTDAAEPVRGLVEKEILRVADHNWSFRSDVLREVAYSTLTKAERARRHAGVAMWIVDHKDAKGSGEEWVERAARHFGASAELVQELGLVDGLPVDLVDRAVDWIERAARRAETDERFGSAERFYGTALHVVAAGTERHRRLLLGRARSRSGLRRLTGAHSDVNAALEAADASGDRHAHAAAITALGDIQQKEGRLDESAETLARAVALWRELGDRRETANALRISGLTHIFRGDHAAARAAADEAFDAFGEVGDLRGQAWALQHRAWVAYMDGRAEEAEHTLNQAIEAFNDLGDAGGLLWALGLMGFIMFHQGRFDEAEALAAALIDETRDRGDGWGHAMINVLLGSIRLWRGSAEDGLRWGEKAVAAFREINDRQGEVQGLCLVGRALLPLGRIDEATRTLDEAVALASESPSGPLGFARIAAAAAAMQIGDGARALELLGPLADLPVEGDIGIPDLLVARGLARLQQGDAEGAFDDLRAATRITGGRSAYAASGLAAAHATAGNLEEALAEARRALEAPTATYLDRVIAHLAVGLANAHVGDATAAGAAFDAALTVVDDTDDVVAAALVRLARSYGLLAVSHPDAEAVRRDAFGRLDDLGLEPSGWAAAFEQSALGGLPLEELPAS